MKYYTKEDEEFLKLNYGKMPVKEISKILQRGQRAIINKAYKMGLSKKNLTDKQLEQIKKEYKSYNIEELAKELGITKHTLCRVAKEQGVTRNGKKQKYTKSELPSVNDKNDQQYLKSLKQSEKNSLRAKRQIQTKGHPKGFLGKTHTKKSKEIMSIKSKSAWADPESKMNTEEFRQKKSDYMMKMQASGNLRRGYSRGNQGKRPDLDNTFFRSSWEANYARYLNFLISQKQLYKWEFEPDTFWFHEIKRGTRSYLPDFKIWETETSTPYYVEVKGWMDAKSKTKLKRMEKYYPNIEVRIVGEKEYKEIKRKVAPFIKNWE